jgi:hypothetical protein
MSHFRRSLLLGGMLCSAIALCLGTGAWSTARQMLATGADTSSNAPTAARAIVNAATRPHYRIDAAIDYELLTLKSTADVMVPVDAGDSLSDVVFFHLRQRGRCRRRR